MSLFFAFAVACFFGGTSVDSIVVGSRLIAQSQSDCLNVKTPSSLDVERLMGSWYRLYDSHEPESKCVKETYKFGEDDTILLEIEENMLNLEPKQSPFDPEKSSTLRILHRPDSSQPARFIHDSDYEPDQLILETDYDTHAVVLECIQIDDEQYESRVQILKRQQKLGNEDEKTVAFFKANPHLFPHNGFPKFVRQEGCLVDEEIDSN